MSSHPSMPSGPPPGESVRGRLLVATPPLGDPNFDRTPYEPFIAYGRSKTANILFAVEFDRRHKAAGIRATAVHPGGISTELGRYAFADPDALQKRVDEINAAQVAAGKEPFRLKSIPQGAATSLWAGGALFPTFLILTAAAVGVLARWWGPVLRFFFPSVALAKAANGRPAIPYGVAIAAGGLFVAINLY